MPLRTGNELILKDRKSCCYTPCIGCFDGVLPCEVRVHGCNQIPMNLNLKTSSKAHSSTQTREHDMVPGSEPKNIRLDFFALTSMASMVSCPGCGEERGSGYYPFVPLARWDDNVAVVFERCQP